MNQLTTDSHDHFHGHPSTPPLTGTLRTCQEDRNPKMKGSSSNHQFSGAFAVSPKEGIGMRISEF